MIELTRRYGFPASHVLAQPSLSQERNERIYGRCANPNGHGHDYGVELTVGGPLDARSGRVVDPARLDALFAEHVGGPFGGRHLNDLEAFRERVPTAENIAIAIHERLDPALAAAGTARLLRVRVVETRNNSFCYGTGTGAP